MTDRAAFTVLRKCGNRTDTSVFHQRPVQPGIKFIIDDMCHQSAVFRKGSPILSGILQGILLRLVHILNSAMKAYCGYNVGVETFFSLQKSDCDITHNLYPFVFLPAGPSYRKK